MKRPAILWMLVGALLGLAALSALAVYDRATAPHALFPRDPQ